MRRRFEPRCGRLLLAAALLSAASVSAGERLVLIGGGDHPPEARKRFVEWAGGGKARILVVLWGTSEPKESFDWIHDELVPEGAGSVEGAPLAPLTETSRAQFLGQLATATGVYFSGGVQARFMDVLKDQPLLAALRERYRAGVVFGGTSAGCAVMSTPMITGEGDFTVIDGGKVETREGLGLLPNIIVDQHFVKRQRENRLFGLILLHPELRGVGVDEATALMVRDNRYGEVAGQGHVMLVDAGREPGALVLHLFKDGERVDLAKGRRP
jgi:cyanophycinase